jgi:hypothetical protein
MSPIYSFYITGFFEVDYLFLDYFWHEYESVRVFSLKINDRLYSISKNNVVIMVLKSSLYTKAKLIVVDDVLIYENESLCLDS